MPVRGLAESKRYGKFLYTPVMKGRRQFHRISYEKTNLDVPYYATGKEQREDLLQDLTEGISIYESISEHYFLENSLEEFIEDHDAFSELENVLEEGFLPEEDRTDLQKLLEEELGYL